MPRIKQASAAGLHFELVRKPLDREQIIEVATAFLQTC
jgi:hypothetical protein